MYQNYNYYPQQTQQPQMSVAQQSRQTGLKGRPVSSIEEARASVVDFDGTIFYFPDLANKCIYTKQINMDGTATLNLYELKQIPVSRETNDNFVTRDEFETAINQLKAVLIPKQQPAAPPKQEIKAF